MVFGEEEGETEGGRGGWVSLFEFFFAPLFHLWVPLVHSGCAQAAIPRGIKSSLPLIYWGGIFGWGSLLRIRTRRAAEAVIKLR